MTRPRGEELLTASWEGRLAPEERAELEEQLARDPDLRRVADTWTALAEVERSEPMEVPSERMRQRLSGALDAVRVFESRGAAAARSGSSRWLAVAAWLVGVGLLGGILAAGWWGARRDVRDLRAELDDLRDGVVVSLLEHQAASERLRAVSWSERGPVDGTVLDALVETVSRDPSVNVRLAAIDALSGHLDGAGRRRLAASLPDQASPLVQLRLVEALFTDGSRGLDVEGLLAPGVLDETVRRRLAELIGRSA